MAFHRLRLLVLFALILSSGPLHAASMKEESAYAAAVAAFQDEMWSRAETEFAQFTQNYPKSTNAPEAVLFQAQAQFKQGKFTTAIALLADTNHLAKAGTVADQYVYWTGEGRFQNHDFAGAAETLVSVARDFPDSSLRLRAVVEAAAAQAQLGQWLQISQLLEETNGVFQRAAQMDPANALVSRGQLMLAQATFSQNEFGTAANILTSLNPQTLPPQLDWQRSYLLYQVKLAAGDTNAALAAATNLVQIAGLASDDNLRNLRAESVSLQADILKKSGRVAGAEAAYQQNLTTNAPVEQQQEAVLNIAELAAAQNQFSEAEMNLDKFIAQFTNSPAQAIALLTLGELHLKDHAAQPGETNHLQEAQAKFNQFLGLYTNSATAGLAGKAYLDRGWCEWLSNDTNSLADFEAAAQSTSLPPEDRAVALFKAGDAMLALTNYAGALDNYRAVLDDFTDTPAVAMTLGDRALYQSLRANLELTNYDGASSALAQILEQYPASDLATNSVLLYGEGLAEASEPAKAREQFQRFESQFPDSLLRPQVEFAIARTYELEGNRPGAIAGYQGWLDDFPTNDLRPQTVYALARANYQAGNETNAFGLFTGFVAQFPTNDLAPQAQWWVADYFFRTNDFVDAEKNYKYIFQNTNWLDSSLVSRTNLYQAQLMAGYAAVGRLGYSDAIRDYFSKLEEDTNCLVDLRVQAALAHGEALMREESPDTNSPLANFQFAIKIFGQIAQWDPTNPLVAMATIGIGDCNLQLTNFDDATNAYAQVVNSANASVSARSHAQIGIGIALEKMAATLTGTNQTAALQEAKENYLDVFYTWTGQNLHAGEKADPFWVEKAGLQALPLIETLGTANPDKFVGQMEDLFPQLKDKLEKIRAALPPETN